MSKKDSPAPLWTPLPGPQVQALESRADILFYGGAAGGGKTDLLLGAAHTKHRRSIIFRREYPQLRAIVDRSLELFSDIGKFNKTEMLWQLEDGRSIEFGAVQHLGDERRYQGRPHDLKAFDELAHFSEAQFRTLCGWLRSNDTAQRCRVIAVGNPPVGSDGDWILRFFAPWLDPSHPRPAKPGELRWFTTLSGKDTEVDNGREFEYRGELIIPKSRTFIPARVEDNPYYMASGYKATLQALPEPMRAKMLYGDFTAGREDDPDQLIPAEWIKRAQSRWSEKKPEAKLSCIGVDVARGGDDRTVITLRYGAWFDRQRIYPGKETPSGDAVAQLVLKARGAGQCKVNIDVIGVGASAYDSLRRHIGLDACPMHAAESSRETDRSGQIAFANKRAEWWWTLRDALDPESGESLALPPDTELFYDLATPRYLYTPRGIQVERKDKIIERLGRSPDKGDSFVLAYAIPRLAASGFIDYYESLTKE